MRRRYVRLVLVLVALCAALVASTADASKIRAVRPIDYIEAVSDEFDVARGGILTIPSPGVLRNDIGAGRDVRAVLVTSPAHGTLTLASDGSFTYQNDGSAAVLDSFAYHIRAGGSDSNLAQVIIHVRGTVSTPAAAADRYAVASGATLTVAAPGILANDSDAQAKPLFATLVSGPTHGTLTLNASGSFVYVNDGRGSSRDSFTYTATNGVVASTATIVTIDITPVNAAPVARPDAITVSRGGTVRLGAPGLLANDTDAEGSPMTAVLVGTPSHGSVTVATDGSVIYSHDGSATTSDTFTYTASDGQASSAPATVTVTVVNTAPVASGDAYTVAANATLTVPAPGVIVNDVDVDGDALRASVVVAPTHGTLVLNGDGSFTYTNAGGTSDTFSYRVNDGLNDSNPATVSISVATAIVAPTAADDSYSIVRGGTLTIGAPGLLANDSDVQHNPLSATVATPPSHGSVTINSDGSFVYRNSGDVATTDSFTYRANNGAASSTATVRLTITASNQPPVANGDLYSVVRGTVLTIDAPGILGNDSDPEGAALTARLVAGPFHGSVTLAADGSFVYTNDGSVATGDSFTYVSNDGTADSQSATVTLNIIPPATPPTATADHYSVLRGALLSIAAPGVLSNDNDPQHNPLAAILVTTTSHGALTLGADGSLSYQNDGSSAATDSFTYRVSNGTTQSTAVTVTIDITAVSTPPVANNDAYSVTRSNQLSVPPPGVLGNDTASGASTLTASPVTPPAHGTLTLSPDGSFVYQNDGSSATADSFTYKASDGQSQSNTATASISITAANQPPTAVADNYTVLQGGSVTIAPPGVLANDTDPESSPITATQVTAPQHGSLTLNANGGFTYTHDGSATTSDTFTYKANDGQADSLVVTVTITVTPSNHAPVASNDTYTTAQDTAIAIAAPGVLANDTDADNNALTALLVTTPAHGTVTLANTGALNYTPAAGFLGTDTFTYKANDGTADSNTATITINVIDDKPPFATNDAFNTPANTPLTIAAPGVLANDISNGVSALTALMVTAPAHGTATLNANGGFTYTPAVDFSGTDSFTYVATKASNNRQSAPATVTITVAPNVPPAGVNDSYSVAHAGTLTIAAPGVLANDTDPDDAFMSAALDAAPLHGTLTLNGNGSFTYTHDGSNTLSDSFTYHPIDGHNNLGSQATVTIHVGADAAPQAVNDAYTTAEDTPLPVAARGVLANDTDVDTPVASLTAAVVTQPAHGALVLNGDGSFTYTPAANYNGPDTFTYKANDGIVDSTSATVTITVTSINDVPSFTKGSDQSVLEDAGAQTVAGWATAISSGPADEAGQALNFVVTNSNNALFSGQPAIAPNGTLTYTPAANANGTATVTVQLHDNGGTANGGVDTSASQTFTISVTAVNDVPSFVRGANVTVSEDASAYSQAWATAISAGPADESAQALNFIVTNDNNALFAAQPAISASGLLTFAPAANANGSTTVTVQLHDNGGIANGGVDTTAAITFTITVTSVNDVPSFTKGADQVVLEDAGPQTVAGWATAMSAGPADEAGQLLNFVVTNNNNLLFSVQPSINATTGALTYTPLANAYGVATVTVQLHDNGGTANGGIDTSAAQTFTITVTGINDVPSFTKGANQTVLEDSGAAVVAGWATGISAGSNESSQTVNFIVTNTNSALFLVQPAVAANGTLTFTPAPNANGSVTVTVQIHDDGGVANGGADTSAAQTFTITIVPVNDAPLFTKGANQTAAEDGGAQTVNGWATSIAAGPADEAAQALNFIVTNDNNALFAVQPAIDAATGTLTYTPAGNANGAATVTVQLHDNGGVANGGADTSATQTFTITITGVNDPPVNSVPAAQAMLEDASLVFSTAAANAISVADVDANGGVEKVTLTATNGTLTLAQTTGLAFSTGTGTANATMSFTGTLANINAALDGMTFVPTSNYNGAAAVQILTDDQGNSGSGGALTDTKNVTITVTAVNDAPSFTKGANATVLEDSGAQTFAAWATAISAGPADEAAQALNFIVTNNNNALFSVQPSIDATTGTLTFTPAANATGTTTVTVQLHDNGGLANGGADTSAAQTFTITITPVNDVPAFTKGADQTVLEDSGAATVAGWATGITAGPNESSQAVNFIVTNNNNALFSVQPAVAANGTLTFTPAANANGSATVTIQIHDDGGVSNGGVDTSATQTFAINVTAVNDAPSFTKGANQTVLEDAGAQTVNGWATAMSAGPADEAGQALDFIVTNDSNALFSVQPAIDASGNLTYTPAANAFGSATVTVKIHDNGGVLNGGVDLSASQTFTIAVTGVNDVPSFAKGANQTVLEDSGAASVAGWATAITAGPNEGSQTVNFIVTNNNNALFSAQPAVAANGTLTFTPATNANGTATVTIQIHDDGGLSNGGVDTSASQTFTITVTAVNDAPSFTKGANQTVLEDAGAQTVNGWATAMSAGPADEAGQALDFIVTNDNNALFSVQPAIDASGNLTYTPAANAFGSATVTVKIHDNGGVLNGGVDLSASQTFTIAVTGVNDVPSFTKGANQTVLEDSGAASVAGWATALSAGPNESSQTVNFIVSNDNNALFSAQPAVASNGTLTFTPAANANGSATVTVQIHDDGGLSNGGVDTSASQTFTITVTAVNDAPSFTKGANQTVLEDAAAQTVNGWATAMSAGPADEAGQALDFIVTNDNNALFAVQPAIDASGNLTYTPAANAFGSATVTVKIHDNGGVANSGVDTSAGQTFTITLTAVNDVPSFTKGANQTVLEDSGAASVAGWATAISAGPNEGSQTVDFIVTNNNNPLFSVQPAVAADGTLTFTPATNANGSATVTIQIHDDGGLSNGGVNTSAAQTFTITVTAVNDAPSFTKGANQTALEDAGAQTVNGWATAMSAGPADESGQALDFIVTNDNNGLFSVQPVIDASGNLTYTPAANAFGSATVTVKIHDNGGTANGGVDASATQTFTITVTPVNDQPSFTKGGNQTVLEDSGTATFAGWATAITAGPNESSQTVNFIVTNDNNSLFSIQPAVASNGTLTFTPAANANGSTTVSVQIHDDGGLANGGLDTSGIQTFTITVTAVNDAPSFTKGADQNVLENSGAYSVSGWATAISKGPADESGQSLTFSASNDNTGLFAVQPSVSSTGVLTYTLATNVYGTANVLVSLKDDGGTANGGADTSLTQTFVINVANVNVAPSFTKGSDQTVLEDAGAQSVPNWATGINPGPGEGSQTVSFQLSNNNNTLFAVQPAVSSAGTLTYTPAANANGSATVSIVAKDDGGTANGGTDTSAAQVFTINVTAVNDAPVFLKGADQTVAEDAGAQSVNGWATAISAGPADESGQVLTFQVTANSNPTLFSAGPAIGADGTLAYTPAANANGSATITVRLTDDGGTANGGVDASAGQTFTITVTAVNDAPSFAKGADQTALEDAAAQTVAGWATAISAGPNEGSQNVDFLVSNDNTSLFSVQPAIAANGTLTYTPAANANGVANVTVRIHDDGGLPGTDTSAAQTFTITITPVNDPPTFAVTPPSTPYFVIENAGAQSVPNFITSITSGPSNESSQTVLLSISGNTNPGMFAAGPSISSTGTLTFTPATNSGQQTATITVTATDDGGNANGGVDNSSQTFVISIEKAPTVTSTTPTNGGTAATSTSIVVNFSESVNATTSSFTVTCGSTAQSFTLSASPASSYTLTASGGAWTAGTCTVTVLAAQIHDVDANDPPDGLASDYSFSFTANTPPTAASHTITDIGNVAAVLPAPGLLTGASDPDAGQTLSVVGGTYATSDGGSIVIASNGSFTYTPAAGHKNATDTVTFTISDGVGGTANATLTINLQNQRVWFVKDTGTAVAGGTGTQSSPFTTMAQAFAAATSGETIYVLKGAGATGLDNTTGHLPTAGVLMVGEGIPTDVTQTLSHTTLPATTVTLISATGAPATITRSTAGATITIANGASNTIQGLNITSTTGAAITAAAAIGTLTMNNGVTITSNGGPALSLPGGALAATIDSVTANAGATTDGLTLTGVTGSLTITGGAITGGGTSNNGVNITGGTAAINIGAAISSAVSKGGIASITNRTTAGAGAITLSGALTSADKGITVTGNTAAQVITFSGAVSLTTGANAAVNMSGNTSATINYTGGVAITTTTGSGFVSTGGSTVTVTGTNNTVSTGAATYGVNVTSTIGAAGVTFKSINTTGATTGLLLQGTGANAFSLTGDGSTAGSAGTINAATGISLTTTGSESIKFVTVTGCGTACMTGSSFGTLTADTISLTGGGSTVASFATGTINGNFSSIGGTAAAANAVVLSSVAGNFSVNGGTLGHSSGAGDVLNLTGNSATIAWKGGLSYSGGTGATVNVTGGPDTSAMTFSTGTISAVAGSGLQFTSANGSYAFNGTTTIGNAAMTAGVNIASSSGTFTFASGTAISALTGTSFTVNGGSAGVTYSGNITQSTASQALLNVTGHSGGTVAFQTGTLSATNGTGLVFANADGTYNFTGTTGLSGGAQININAGADATNGSQGTFSFGSGTTITGGASAPFLYAGSKANVTYSGGISQATASQPLVNVTSQLGGTITFGTGTLSATNGTGLQLTNVGGTINFNGTTTLNGGDAGVDVITSTGTLFFASGVTITSPSGTGFNVSGGSPVISYAGSITQANAGAAVSIASVTGGSTVGISNPYSILISGAISKNTNAASAVSITSNTGGSFGFTGGITASTAGSNAIHLASNTGATVKFTGALDLTTTTGIGFNATGGGTVSASNTLNTITSAGGAALNVANTTIAAANLVFKSISANGGANGIVLNNTGTSGGLTVSGDGSHANNFSGGTIQNTTSHAVSLTNTSNISFDSFRILKANNSGVKGNQVNNFSFTNSTVDQTGVTSGGVVTGTTDDSSLAFNLSASANEKNLTGSVTVTGNTFTNMLWTGFDVVQYNGTISTMNVSNNTITSQSSITTSKGYGIRIDAFGNASTSSTVTKATIDGNIISGFPSGGGIQVLGGNQTAGGPAGSLGTSTSNTIDITNNRAAGFSAATPMSTHAIAYSVAGTGSGYVNINNNGTAANPIGQTVGHILDVSCIGNATCVAAIRNNYVANNKAATGSNGISVGTDMQFALTDVPNLQVTITGNVVSGTDAHGIFVVNRNSAGLAQVRVVNNTVSAPGSTSLTYEGIRVSSGSSSGNVNTCLRISGNTTAGNSAGGFTAPGIGVRKQGSVSTTNVFGIDTLTTSPSTSSSQVETYINSLNPGSATGTYGTGGTDVVAGGGFVSCSCGAAN